MDDSKEFLEWIDCMIAHARAAGDETNAREWEAFQAEATERMRS
jgi:hypothetical protein